MPYLSRRSYLSTALATAGLTAGGTTSAQTSSETSTSVVGIRVITTTEGLEATFSPDGPASLSAGETVFITNENAPYRTTQYLDIDRSNVAVVGMPTDGNLIQPADGADVGGFRVGANRSVENVTVEGIAYDGNPDGQSLSEGGFGIGLFDVTGVTVADCRISRTTPQREHNQANSGVLASSETYNYRIVDNDFDQVGDRAIEAFASHGEIAGNYAQNGYDRMISASDSSELSIHDNRCAGNSDGSAIGISGKTSPSNISIRGNVAYGPHRSLVVIGDGLDRLRNVRIEGNIGFKDGAARSGTDNPWPGIRTAAGGVSISNNTVEGYGRAGLAINATVSENKPILITSNRIARCSRADDRSSPGINLQSGRGLVALNAIVGGQYNHRIGGTETDRFDIGLNFPN